MTDHSAERRQFKRRLFKSTAFVMAGATTVEVHTLDISTGGLCIVADVNPKVGATFSMRITVPRLPKGSFTFVVRVAVTSSLYSSQDSCFRIGLRFLDLDSASHTVISEYVNEAPFDA